MDLDDLRSAMARLPTGVVVVSTSTGRGVQALTASTFVAASLEPPLVLLCLDRLATTREAVEEARRFSVSVLSARQEFFAERFAGRAPLVDPTWREVPHRLGTNGLPIVEGCVAWFECTVAAVHSAGDHDIIVGQVNEAGAAPGYPLVHWERAFWKLVR